MDNAAEPDAKLTGFSDFVDETLRPELKSALAARQQVCDEIADYEELLSSLQQLGLGQSTAAPVDVDLGHQRIYCPANILDATKVFLHVGMGFHVELTTEEARVAVARRVDYLQYVLSKRSDKVRQVRDHLHSAEAILQGLSTERSKGSSGI